MADTRIDGNPLVSIIIPVYNGANFVAAAIDSALAQTWPNIEIIVVDDGSDDAGATARICATYGERIRYFYKTNGGVATALNFAVQVMRGEFFSWLSHDDIYLPHRIETMLTAFAARAQAPDVDRLVLHSDVELIDETGARIRGVHRAMHPDSDRVIEHGVNGCSLLIPRRCFELAGLFHPGLPTTQDTDMWLRLRRVGRMERVIEITVGSRQHGGQGSHAYWHRLDAALNRLSLLDRIDSSFFRYDAVRRREVYRRFVARGRFGPFPGVHADAVIRTTRVLRAQSVSLVCTGWRGGVSHGVLPLLWRNGFRVSMVRLGHANSEQIVAACAELSSDLLWLWDGPLDVPGKMLEQIGGMMDLLVADPRVAACLCESGRETHRSGLRAFHGALVPTRAFRAAVPSESGPWTAVAHEIVRLGGFRQFGRKPRAPGSRARPAPPGTAVASQEGTVRAMMLPRKGEPFVGAGVVESARRRGNPDLASLVRAWIGVAQFRVRGWAASVVSGWMRSACGKWMQWRGPLHDGPGLAQRAAAALLAHPRVAERVNRWLWSSAQSPAHARLRLMRFHGLAGHFDPYWYSRAYDDVAASGLDPVLHYLCIGYAESRDPSPGFDARAYLEDHEDAAARCACAIRHYSLWGRFEGRRVRRSRRADIVPAGQLAAAVLVVIAEASPLVQRVARDLTAQLRRNIEVVTLQRLADGRVGVLARGMEEPEFLSSEEAVSRALRTASIRRAVFVGAAAELSVRLAEAGVPGDVVHFPDDPDVPLSVCRRYAFSHAHADALGAVLPAERIEVVDLPDPGGMRQIRPWLRTRHSREFCRVAIFGDLGAGADLEVLLATFDMVQRRRLPFTFVLFGQLEAELPVFGDMFGVVPPAPDGHSSIEALSAFNPHVAWVPCSDAARAVFPLMEAVTLGLPLAATWSKDANEGVAGRPLTWLRPPATSPMAWLGLLHEIHARKMPHGAWQPDWPMEGFDPRGKELSRAILDDLRLSVSHAAATGDEPESTGFS